MESSWGKNMWDWVDVPCARGGAPVGHLVHTSGAPGQAGVPLEDTNMEESHISEVGAGGSLDSAEKMQRMGPTPVYTPAGCLDFVHEPKLHLVAVM